MTEKYRIEIRELSVSFDGKSVLDGAGLAACAGETIAICGRSGSGKSTLLQRMACLGEAQAGEAYLDGAPYMRAGRPIVEPWLIRREVTMVFQNYCLFPNLIG